MKQIIAKRVPPGDRWSIEKDEVVHPSLTDCLNAIHMVNGATRFDIDARSGKIFTDDGVVKPEPIKKYSLYGEEM